MFEYVAKNRKGGFDNAIFALRRARVVCRRDVGYSGYVFRWKCFSKVSIFFISVFYVGNVSLGEFIHLYKVNCKVYNL